MMIRCLSAPTSLGAAYLTSFENYSDVPASYDTSVRQLSPEFFRIMLRIRLDLPDPVITALTANGPLYCTCNNPLTSNDSYHLHVCGKLARSSVHDKVNEAFLQPAKWAKCSVLGDRAFRKCGLAQKPKYPDGAIYGLEFDGGPLVIDTRVVSPLAASNLVLATTSYCATALSGRKSKFKEYLDRIPAPADFSCTDKSMEDLYNPLRPIDISDHYGKIRFLPLVVEMYGGCAPEVHYYLSSLASRLSEQNAHSSHTHLYSFFKSILKKRVSMALAHQVCVNHSRMRHSILTRVLNNTVTTSEPTTGVILDAE